MFETVFIIKFFQIVTHITDCSTQINQFKDTQIRLDCSNQNKSIQRYPNQIRLFKSKTAPITITNCLFIFYFIFLKKDAHLLLLSLIAFHFTREDFPF